MIGLQGFETSENVKALGFIKNNCTTVTEDETWQEPTTDSGLILEETSGQDNKSLVTASVSVSLFLIVFFSTLAVTTCALCCCLYCLLNRTQKRRLPKLNRDASLIHKINKIEHLDDVDSSSKYDDVTNYGLQ